ncbi:hypothetical protein PIB30_085694 [Stylosanthes scabra]|uniref:Uncharacterized protein n=1 Tax=Stylosanthes scabra TaxID=79078 RepID=A0ABU6ZRK1_9FABA|nr:hypothetical protein [Stylosanthes scabra]
MFALQVALCFVVNLERLLDQYWSEPTLGMHYIETGLFKSYYGSQKKPSHTERERGSKSTTNPDVSKASCSKSPTFLMRFTKHRISSPPIKMRTPPSRASPRLAALKNSPFPLSPTSVLEPKKLLVLALTVPKPMLHPITHVQKDPETPIPEIPRVPKMRRTARISVKPVWLQFPERVLAERRSSIATTEEKVVISDSSDSKTSKKVEDDNMELVAMDEPFVQMEKVEEEEEEEDPEEDLEEEEGEVEYFRDEEDYEGYFSEENDNCFDGSTGSN